MRGLAVGERALRRRTSVVGWYRDGLLIMYASGQRAFVVKEVNVAERIVDCPKERRAWSILSY